MTDAMGLFLFDLARLLELHGATFVYTVDDDGIHASIGEEDVCLGHLCSNPGTRIREVLLQEGKDGVVCGADSIKRKLVDAVCGCPLGSMRASIEFTNRGLARFTGNQWNADWAWERKGLEALDIKQLEALYASLCEARIRDQKEMAELIAEGRRMRDGK